MKHPFVAIIAIAVLTSCASVQDTSSANFAPQVAEDGTKSFCFTMPLSNTAQMPVKQQESEGKYLSAAEQQQIQSQRFELYFNDALKKHLEASQFCPNGYTELRRSQEAGYMYVQGQCK